MFDYDTECCGGEASAVSKTDLYGRSDTSPFVGSYVSWAVSAALLLVLLASFFLLPSSFFGFVPGT